MADPKLTREQLERRVAELETKLTAHQLRSERDTLRKRVAELEAKIESAGKGGDPDNRETVESVFDDLDAVAAGRKVLRA